MINLGMLVTLLLYSRCFSPKKWWIKNSFLDFIVKNNELEGYKMDNFWKKVGGVFPKQKK
jgi:hypothetical protein